MDNDTEESGEKSQPSKQAPPTNTSIPKKSSTGNENFVVDKKVLFFFVLGLVVLCFSGYFIYKYIKYNKSKITELELIKDSLEKELDNRERKFEQKIRELSGNLAKDKKVDESPKESKPSGSEKAVTYNGQMISMPRNLSTTEPSGGMIVYVNGGNMNVSEVNLGNGAKMSFSGLRWTGSIPNLVTNMLASEVVGSVTEHKVPPFEDVVFEKTQESLTSVWVSGRTYHDFLVAYNVGTTNSPIWVEPTSSDKVTGVRIKSLGPELTVKFTVKKRP